MGALHTNTRAFPFVIPVSDSSELKGLPGCFLQAAAALVSRSMEEAQLAMVRTRTEQGERAVLTSALDPTPEHIVATLSALCKRTAALS